MYMKDLLKIALWGALSFPAIALASCGSQGGAEGDAGENDSIVHGDSATEIATRTLEINEEMFHKKYLVADINDARHIYKEKVKPENVLVVISKREYRLYVYDTQADTTLAASFPICYALNTGQKTGNGDNCTPHCDLKHPFHVSEIKDASTWCFDFEDGRGMIKAFGNWFIRLDLSGSFPNDPAVAANRSIGIHGSTGNEPSVPGRDSHGCVRMLDEDLCLFHDNYASVGMPVVIKPFKQAKLPFELRAEQALGDKYQPAKLGHPAFAQQQSEEEGVG